ncbi:MAG: cupin domain-containing protein [Eubacterium sp.]|nr:cupin domain-containing protein [Candidatus Colimonas fimequi]
MNNIGQKIKNLRVENGLTQSELADRSELTKGFISQVENGNTLPSIPTLVDLLQCLGTDLKHFFGDDEDKQIVFKEEDYFEKIDESLLNKIEFIVPNAQKNMMEPILLTLEPGGSTYPDNPHEGEEFGYVISGEVTVVIGGTTQKAKKGETFYYVAKDTHYLKSNRGAKVIWVSTPPSF